MPPRSSTHRQQCTRWQGLLPVPGPTGSHCSSKQLLWSLWFLAAAGRSWLRLQLLLSCLGRTQQTSHRYGRAVRPYSVGSQLTSWHSTCNLLADFLLPNCMHACSHQPPPLPHCCTQPTPPPEPKVEVEGVVVLPVVSGIKCLRGVCNERLKYEVEYSLKKGTSENSYLLSVSVCVWVWVCWCWCAVHRAAASRNQLSATAVVAV